MRFPNLKALLVDINSQISLNGSGLLLQLNSENNFLIIRAEVKVVVLDVMVVNFTEFLDHSVGVYPEAHLVLQKVDVVS